MWEPVARSQHKDGYGSLGDPAHDWEPADVSKKKRSLQFWQNIAKNSIHHLYLVKMKRLQTILDVFLLLYFD